MKKKYIIKFNMNKKRHFCDLLVMRFTKSNYVQWNIRLSLSGTTLSLDVSNIYSAAPAGVNFEINTGGRTIIYIIVASFYTIFIVATFIL